MTLRAQVIFPRNTGLSEDAVVNNWSFGPLGQADDQETFDNIFDRLSGFYQAIHGVYGTNVVLSDAVCKIYNLDDPSPGREPTYEAPLTGISNSTNDPTASQVAIVLSFRGPPTGGQPARRSRGRVYLGPISRSTESSSDRDRIDSSIVDQIMDAAIAELAPPGDPEVPHVVFSAKDYTDPDDVVHEKKPSQPADHAHPVDTYWVDNRFDIQRRRGKKATTRDTRTV